MDISKDVNKILIVVGSWGVVIVDCCFSTVFSYDNILVIENAENLNFLSVVDFLILTQIFD